VHLKLETPRQLTARQKELMEEFREEEKAATESAKVKRSQGFVDAAWDRLRSFMGTDTKEDGKKKDKTSKKKSQKN
jgi:DnaJ-class molecular chaperone